MVTRTGSPSHEFQKGTRQQIGDRGLFTTNPQHAHGHSHRKPANKEAYLTFLKEERDIQYRRLKKSDHARVAFIVVYCSLPILIFLISYWW